MVLFLEEIETIFKETLLANMNTPTTMENASTDYSKQALPHFKGTIIKEVALDYTQEQIDTLGAMYETASVTNKQDNTADGKVIFIGEGDVIFDLGMKSDGVVPYNELKKDFPNLQVGDKVSLYIKRQENLEQKLEVSYKLAQLHHAWQMLQLAKENDTAVEGFVKRKIKGGLVLDVNGLEVFMPNSHIGNITPGSDDNLIGEKMSVSVVGIDTHKNNAVVSRKKFLAKEQEEQQRELMSTIERGKTLLGHINSIAKFGVFVNIGGGIKGLLSKYDISNIKSIDDVSKAQDEEGNPLFTIGEEIQVVVKDYNLDKLTIALSTKLFDWARLPDIIEPSSKVKGKIVDITQSLITLEIISGVHATLKASEVSHGYPRPLKKVFSIGQELEVEVLELNKEEELFTVSLKKLLPNPWAGNVEARYAPSTKHKGRICVLSKYSLLVELEQGVDGRISQEEISWTKKKPDLGALFKEGDQVEVIVTGVDTGNRIVDLSLRQLIENPWHSLQTQYALGSIHKAKILVRAENHFLIEAGEVQAYVHRREIPRKAQMGDTVDLYVADFIPEEQKVIFAAAKSSGHHKDEDSHEQAHQSNAPKAATLGDLGVLQKLKEDLAKKRKQDAEKKKPKVKQKGAIRAKAKSSKEKETAKKSPKNPTKE